MSTKRSKRVQNFRKKTAKLKELPVSWMLPNVVTIMALCTGLSAVRFAMQKQWELAVIAVFVAAFFDAMDGRLARFLGRSTHFGAELDSLSDVVNFGVVPCLLLYIRSLKAWDNIGWVVCLFFAVCCSLRLARFNTSLGEEYSEKPWMKKFFIGVSAPAGALLTLVPLILELELKIIKFPPIFHALFLVGVGGLMVSRIPTFSFKGMQVPRKAVLPFLLIVTFGTAALINMPWMTLTTIGILYLATIPFSVRSYRKHLSSKS